MEGAFVRSLVASVLSLPQSTARAMKEFKERTPAILDALFRAEQDSRAGGQCSCDRAGFQALFRCVDCSQHTPSCSSCIVAEHAHHPFHRVQKWTGRYFRRWSLAKSGFRLCLGHDGARCPSNLTQDVDAMFTIVHTNGLHSVPVLYCRCSTSEQVPFQLIAASLYPATWDSPRTAFTTRLLKFFHLDSLQTRKPAHDAWAVLRRLTDNTRADGLPVSFALRLAV